MTPAMSGTAPVRCCSGVSFGSREGRIGISLVCDGRDVADGFGEGLVIEENPMREGCVRQDKGAGTKGRLSCCLYIIFHGAMFCGRRFPSAKSFE
jgi:hypothetical protein